MSLKKTTKTRKTINAAAADTYAPIAMQGELTIEAAADDKKVPTFQMEAYNGGMMRLSGWYHPVVVELSGMTIPSQTMPVRMQHDARQGVGHTTQITKTKAKLSAKGIISRDTIFARDVINSSKNGFPWQVSMGAAPNEVLLITEKQKFKANGQTFDGPAYLVAKSTLGELSFVDLGADTSTSAAIAAENNPVLEKDNLMLNIKQMRLIAQSYTGRLKVEQIDSAILAAAESEENEQAFTARLDALVEAAAKQPEKPVQAAADAPNGIDDAHVEKLVEARITAETARQNTIRAEGKGLGIASETIEAMATDRNITVEAARGKFLEEVRKIHASGVMHAPAGIVVDKDVRSTQVIEAAAYMATGCGTEEKALKFYGEKTLEAAAKIRSLSLQGLFILAAQAEGKNLPLYSMGANDFIRAAFTTTSLPGILGNLANKVLLEGYMYGEEVWRKICRIRPVKDFKPQTQYRLGADMQYSKVGPGGELKPGKLTEQSYTLQADTEGVMIALTRKMIIDDDLGAFTQIPFELGMGASDAINAAVWTLLEDNTDNFFHADNANLPTVGAGNALALDSLVIANTAFRDFKKPNGQPLGMQAKSLVVPTALEFTADQLMKSAMLNGSTTANKFMPTTNVYAGKYEVVGSAHLTSATSWYLFADPMRLAALAVGFLNGVDRPTIESGQPNFDTLGIQMRAYLDFGAAKQEPKAAVKMALA